MTLNQIYLPVVTVTVMNTKMSDLYQENTKAQVSMNSFHVGIYSNVLRTRRFSKYALDGPRKREMAGTERNTSGTGHC